MVFQPDNAISGGNGGGGNRTRVGSHPETATVQRKPAGWVYLVTDGLTYKIGHAQDPAKRLTLLQTGHPETLSIVAVVEGTQTLERELHELFAGSHLRGEWFVRDKEIASYFDEHGWTCVCRRRAVDPDCFIHGDLPSW